MKEEWSLLITNQLLYQLSYKGICINDVFNVKSQLNQSLKNGDCSNSVYNEITITIDFILDNPKKVRISSLRNFGESFIIL